MAGLKKARMAKQKASAKAAQYLNLSLPPTVRVPAPGAPSYLNEFVMTTDDMAGKK